MKQYNEIIRELREDHDFSQSKIAQLLGINQQTYSKYEKGSLQLPIKHLISLGDFYNVSTDYILARHTENQQPIETLILRKWHGMDLKEKKAFCLLLKIDTEN